jgi:hypothetical protein
MPIREGAAPSRSLVREPDWRLRLRVLVGRRGLDREIAEGACLDGTPARALRARQLTSASGRHAIAGCLANILDAAEECHTDVGSRLILEHRAVTACRREITELVDRLRGDSIVDVRGIALARVLTENPTSPLFHRGSGQTLEDAVAEIIAAL